MEQLKKFSPAFYAVIILLFFLPFVNLSCGGQKITSVTGFQLVTGTEISSGMMGENMFGGMNNNSEENKKEVEPQAMALLALFAAIAGLILSLMKKKPLNLINLIISVLGVIFLIILKFNLEGNAKLDGQGMITLDFQFAYWLSVLIFILTAVIGWLIYNEKENTIAQPPPATTPPPAVSE